GTRGSDRGGSRVLARGSPSGVGGGRDVRDREDRAGADPRADSRALRSAPRRVPAVPAPAPADLPEDRGVRPLRPRRPRLHVGEDGQGGPVARARGPRAGGGGSGVAPVRRSSVGVVLAAG